MVQRESVNTGSTARPQITYSSKLMAALNKFAGVLSNEVKNPMLGKYGEAYEFLIKGDALRVREETEDAIRAYEKATTLNPRFIEAYIGMGKCFRRKGDLRRAIAAYTKALKLNSFDKETHVEIAKAYNEGGFQAKGIHHFRQALKIDPRFIEAKFHLALCLELQGQTTEPMRLYEEIIREDAEFLPAYNNLGSIYMREGMYGHSETMFRKLIELAPDFSRGYLGLAISLDRTNRPNEALRFYEQLLTMKAQQRNRDYIENRVNNLRQELGRHTDVSVEKKVVNGPRLVRIK